MAREYSLERTRNFGIIAHIDAGKTTVLASVISPTICSKVPNADPMSDDSDLMTFVENFPKLTKILEAARKTTADSVTATISSMRVKPWSGVFNRSL